MDKLMKLVFVAFIVFAILIAGCNIEDAELDSDNGLSFTSNKKSDGSFENLTNSKMKKFNSTEELSNYLEEIMQQGYTSSNLRYGALEEDMMMAKNAAMDSVSSSSGASDYSKTNVQVEGVDEADFVKNDEKYIYMISGNKLLIVDAYPAEDSEIVSETEIEERASQLFVNGDRLVVFSNDYEKEFAVSEYDFLPVQKYVQKTKVLVYDIEDRKNPEIVEKFSVDGSYFQSRMIGEWVYFIAKETVYMHRNYVDVPSIRMVGGDTLVPEIYYFDNPEENYNFNIVASFNINDVNSLNAKILMLGYSNTLYMSENNMYIAHRKNYPYWYHRDDNLEMFIESVYPLLPLDIREKIDNLDRKDLDFRKQISVLLEDMYNSIEEDEKEELIVKIENAVEKYNIEKQEERAKTIIHKLAVNNGSIIYESKGEVKGYLLNQFSLDEHDVNLRIATTYNIWTNNGSVLYNNVYVLDGKMEQVGKIEKIAPDERIYSTRFMGDKLYMVTFKQVDPLFTINLSDPENPEIIGQLKIPGFSSYLHPYDDTHLIGIGKDTYEENGRVRTKGVKISLFDVSDFENPKEVDIVTIGDSGSYSEAENEHKAVLFDREKNLLVVPIREVEEKYETDENGYFRNKQYSRAYVYTVDESGFEQRGYVEHESEKENGYYDYQSRIKRSLFMEDVLYTISEKMLKMNNLDTVDEINSIDLPQKEYDDYNPYVVY